MPLYLQKLNDELKTTIKFKNEKLTSMSTTNSKESFLTQVKLIEIENNLTMLNKTVKNVINYICSNGFTRDDIYNYMSFLLILNNMDFKTKQKTVSNMVSVPKNKLNDPDYYTSDSLYRKLAKNYNKPVVNKRACLKNFDMNVKADVYNQMTKVKYIMAFNIYYKVNKITDIIKNQNSNNETYVLFDELGFYNNSSDGISRVGLLYSFIYSLSKINANPEILKIYCDIISQSVSVDIDDLNNELSIQKHGKEVLTYSTSNQIIKYATIFFEESTGNKIEIINNEHMEVASEVVDEVMGQLKTERKEYADTLNSHLNELSTVKKELYELRKKMSNFETNSISDKNVLVIADENRMQYYRELVESYNAEFYFENGLEVSKSLKGKAKSADVIFLIVTSAQHDVTNHIKEYSDKIISVNNSSTVFLDRAIKEYQNTLVKK